MSLFPKYHIAAKPAKPAKQEPDVPLALAGLATLATGRKKTDMVVRIENGELRALQPVDDLAAEIVSLTANDLMEQKRLLLLHCERYDEHHFFALGLKWENRVAILEKSIPRILAEIQAAMELNLLAFFDKLRNYDDDEIKKYEGDAP